MSEDKVLEYNESNGLRIYILHVFCNGEKEHRMTWLYLLLDLIQIVASLLCALSFLPSVELTTKSAKIPLGSTNNKTIHKVIKVVNFIITVIFLLSSNF